MGRSVTVTKTRSARRATTEQKTKKDTTKSPKPKKAPSPYNLFVKAQLPIWKEANPGKSAKDAMSAVSVLWKDSPENPKNASGDAKKESKAKKPASKASKPSKKAATDEESPSSESD